MKPKSLYTRPLTIGLFLITIGLITTIGLTSCGILCKSHETPCMEKLDTLQVAGQNEWLPINNDATRYVEIFWSNTGGEGTAQIGISNERNPKPNDITIMPYLKDVKYTVKGNYFFYRSGRIGDIADPKSAFVSWKYNCK